MEARIYSEWPEDCRKMEHMTFLDSASYLPMPLRKLPEAFGLSVNNRGTLTILTLRQI
jgi:hypothetical protein